MINLAKDFQNNPEKFEPDDLGGFSARTDKKKRIEGTEGGDVESDSRGKNRRVIRKNNITINGAPASEETINVLKTDLGVGESETDKVVKVEPVVKTEGNPVVPGIKEKTVETAPQVPVVEVKSKDVPIVKDKSPKKAKKEEFTTKYWMDKLEDKWSEKEKIAYLRSAIHRVKFIAKEQKDQKDAEEQIARLQTTIKNIQEIMEKNEAKELPKRKTADYWKEKFGKIKEKDRRGWINSTIEYIKKIGATGKEIAEFRQEISKIGKAERPKPKEEKPAGVEEEKRVKPETKEKTGGAEKIKNKQRIEIKTGRKSSQTEEDKRLTAELEARMEAKKEDMSPEAKRIVNPCAASKARRESMEETKEEGS